ncbi:MAG TPA: hypothetical protein VFT95_13615 [Micromonosporaceae bacterium]|nr:hypothetical protein [Micromonosporaceae bacterium]
MTDETRIVSALGALADELPPVHVDLDQVVRQAHRRRGRRQAALVAAASTVVAGSLVATMITLTAGREPPGQPPALANDAGWSVTPVPVLGNRASLNAVAPVTQSDVWAVGSFFNDDRGHDNKTVIVHWDGQRWSPAGPTNPGTFMDVAATSSTDVWAVGGATDRTLALHWDGRAWTATPTPSPTPGPGLSSSLNGVAPIASDDVWAVGCQFSAGGLYQSTPLAQHWDGQRWAEVELPPIPDAPQGACLQSVAARGPKDVFAVGHIYGGNVKGGDLTLHWDGTRWSVIPRLTGGTAPYYPNKVIVVGEQVLAVGQSYSLTTTSAAVLRWDGSGWQPTLLDALQLSGATSDGDGGVVVAGQAAGTGPGAFFHSTGGEFRPAEKLPNGLASFTALATVPGTDIVWAVGFPRIDYGQPAARISPGQTIPPITTRQLPTVIPWAGFMSLGG